MKERTLVLIKPDGVQKSLTGKIIQRFEDAGLIIVAMKMVWADEELAKNHYYLEEEWAKNLYDKTVQTYKKQNKEPPTSCHLEWGKTIQERLISYLNEGPVVAIIFEGPHAIDIVRKIIGPTEPRSAPPGTIRGDLASIESYAISDNEERPVKNLIHASDSEESAKREIGLWFSIDEMHSYSKKH